MKKIIISILLAISIFYCKNLSSMNSQPQSFTFKEKNLQIEGIGLIKSKFGITIQSSDVSNYNLRLKAGSSLNKRYLLPKEKFNQIIIDFFQLPSHEKIIYLYQIKKIWKNILKQSLIVPRITDNDLIILWNRKAINYLIKQFIKNPETLFNLEQDIMLVLTHLHIKNFYPNATSEALKDYNLYQLLKPQERIAFYMTEIKPKIVYGSQSLKFYTKKGSAQYLIKQESQQYIFKVNYANKIPIGSLAHSPLIDRYNICFTKRNTTQKIIVLHTLQKIWRKILRSHLRAGGDNLFKLSQIRWYRKALKYLINKIENENSYSFTPFEKIMSFAVFENARLFLQQMN